MTPEQQERANRLNKRISAHAAHGLDGAIYAICCELEAVAAAALAVRTFWAGELLGAGSDVPAQDRLALLHTITASIRITTMATTAMTVIDPLLQETSTQELNRALKWLAGPNSPVGLEGLEKFCKQIATATPNTGAASAREILERIYDRSPGHHEGGANG